jgi:hypothetical protein
VRYLVKVGINYPPKPGAPEKRAEPGEYVDDIPASAVAWLLECDAIEKVT